jgi:hypothetical protein
MPSIRKPPPCIAEATPRRFFLPLKQRSLTALESEIVLVAAVIGFGSLPVVLLVLVVFAN